MRSARGEGAHATTSCRLAPHPVAEPAQRLDELPADLGPEIVDVNLDGVAADVLPAVQALLQLRPRTDDPRPAHQGLQNREFPPRQNDRLAIQRDLRRS